MYYVYILKSLKDGKLYTGATQNLEKRLYEHQIGKNLSTKTRRPLILVHTEYFENRSEACKRERFLKTPKGTFEKYQILKNFESNQIETGLGH